MSLQQDPKESSNFMLFYMLFYNNGQCRKVSPTSTLQMNNSRVVYSAYVRYFYYWHGFFARSSTIGAFLVDMPSPKEKKGYSFWFSVHKSFKP